MEYYLKLSSDTSLIYGENDRSKIAMNENPPVRPKPQRKTGVTRLFIAQRSALQPYPHRQFWINLTRVGMCAVTGVSRDRK